MSPSAWLISSVPRGFMRGPSRRSGSRDWSRARQQLASARTIPSSGLIFAPTWARLRHPAASISVFARNQPPKSTHSTAAALDAGGRSDGGPGLRPHDRMRYYAAFIIDPDGNRMEAVSFLSDVEASE